MAISTASAILGGTAAAGFFGGKAAKEQRKGIEAGIASRKNFFNIALEQLLPFADLGRNAIAGVRNLLGIGDPDFVFEDTDPGAQFEREQGEQALLRRQKATGASLGGRGIKEALRFSAGLARTGFGNAFNRFLSTVGLGQRAAGGIAGAATGTGAGVAGDQRAIGSANAGRFNAFNNAIQGGLGNLTTLNMFNRLEGILGGGSTGGLELAPIPPVPQLRLPNTF